jgi:hypothetical protein
MDGIRKRHVYGATDDIVVDVQSDGHLMGDEFKSSKPPSLDIRVLGAKPIARVDVLKDSEVVATLKPNKKEYRGTWTDPEASKGNHYYYIRILQDDDEIAWSSPMWIDYAP